MIPFLYMLITSFRDNDAINIYGFSFFPPIDQLTFDNYLTVFSSTAGAPVGNWLLNSFVVAISTSLLSVLIASLSAYAYARLKFKGRKLIFSFLLLTMMIPSVISLIPNYLTITGMHLENTVIALIIPALGGVANIFLIRQFLYSIPKELDESALIDGANHLQLFIRIILPQMVPILIVVGLNTFLGSWNDLLWPLIINTDTMDRTMTSGLSIIFKIYDTEPGTIMAITVISALPVLLVYICCQKYLIRGISLTSGMKE
jgi:multiple sugar transport system permease protein